MFGSPLNPPGELLGERPPKSPPALWDKLWGAFGEAALPFPIAIGTGQALNSPPALRDKLRGAFGEAAPSTPPKGELLVIAT